MYYCNVLQCLAVLQYFRQRQLVSPFHQLFAGGSQNGEGEGGTPYKVPEGRHRGATRRNDQPHRNEEKLILR